MAAITTGGSGNWNSTTPNAPWPGGTIPAATDTITIANGHTLTIPLGYTAQCGDPAVPATHAIRTAGTDGTGRLICNGKLEISANVQQGWSHWEFNGAGVKLESKNTTTALTYLFGDANFQNGCRISLIGTGIGAGRAIIQNGAGAAGLRFTVVGGEGQATWQFAKFVDVGTSSLAAITVRDNNYASTNVIEDVEFDNCGQFVIGTLGNAGLNMTVRRLRVVNSKATTSLIIGTGLGSSTGTRIFEDITVVSGSVRIDPATSGVFTPTFTRCFFGGNQTRTGTGAINFVDCHFHNSLTGGALGGASAGANGNITRGFLTVNSPTGTNWHGIAVSNVNVATTCDGLIVDGVVDPTSGDGGDLLFVNRSSTSTSVTIRNVLTTRSPVTASGSYGKLVHLQANPALNGAPAIALIEHNTHYTSTGEAAFIQYGEDVGEQCYAGAVGPLRHNLIYGIASGRGKVIDRATQTAADNVKNIVSVANVTDNTVFNISADVGTNGKGHSTGAGGDGFIWVSRPTDVPTYTERTDTPNFVEERNLATWYRSVVGGAPGTRTADMALALAALASQNGDTPVAGATITAAWAWIRDGYKPQNPALDTDVSGNNGGWVGAVTGAVVAETFTYRGQKAFDSVVIGSTGVTTTVQLELANGTPATGLTHLTAGLKGYFARTGAAATQITLQAQTLAGAWVDGGFVEIDAVNLPGLYRLDVPNAAFAPGAAQVALSFTGTGLKVYTAVAWLVPSRQVFATVGPTPSRYLIRLAGPTVGSGQLLRRQLQVLSGAATHERVTIVDCAANGDLVLSPPLTVVPAEGDRVVIL